MGKVKVTRRVSYSTDFDDKELELSYEAEDNSLKVEKLPDGTYMAGYLVQDEDCSNPVDDCDGMGKLLNKTHRHGHDEKELFSEMGLDGYGNISEDDEEPTPPSKYSVLLHYGEHGPGSGHWSVNVAACTVARADLEEAVRKSDGLWIPKNDCDTDEIESRIKTACFHPSWEMEKLEAEYPELVAKLLPEILIAYVKSCLGPYNEWLSGDCWGVCLDRWDAEGERIEDECDACWGFIGLKCAEDERDDRMEYHRPDKSPDLAAPELCYTTA